MSADQDFEEEFVYKFRSPVYFLGTITIHFQDDNQIVQCICSRMIVHVRSKRKSAMKIHCNLHPNVDQITFPAINIDHPARIIAKNNNCGNNVNQIAVDSTVDEADDRLISSDTDEKATCCCFGNMLRSLRKKLRRSRKRKISVEEKKDVEASTSNYNHMIEPQPFIPNGNACPLTADSEDNDSPLEYSSKYLDNGITHMGYAFEKPIATTISRICWDYDVNRINQWNEPLILQTPINNPRAAALNGSRDVSDLISKVSSIDTDNVLDLQIETGKRCQNGKRNENKKRRTMPETETKAKAIISETLPAEIVADPALKKYWINRYRLFSKFDLGIRLDTESWYSVTPEKISRHIADRCRCDVIIDGFCGAGGNTIQFAFTCERVIAIDIDPKKIELAKHNAKIYEVDDRIEFIVGDFFKVVPTLKADVVFLSPPWGGPSYNSRHSFALSEICPPYGGKAIFDVARHVSEHIAFYLPRNINTCDLMTLPIPNQTLELEQNFLAKKLIAVTAYFGELLDDST